MAFTPAEIATHTDVIEKILWAKRRPPLHLRDKIREGQQIAGHEIEFFFVRPHFFDPGRLIEESIAKARYVRSRDVWQVLWKRADLKWHRYQPRPEVKTLAAFLRLVDEDEHSCFRG